MKSRRATSFWPGELGDMILQYNPGDIVTSTIVANLGFTGVVRAVHPKLNKILVAWGGGSVVQHDPDEIMLHPTAREFAKEPFKASICRRVKKASDFPDNDSFFSITEFAQRFFQFYNQLYLFHWQTNSYAEHVAFAEANEDIEAFADTFMEACQGRYGRINMEKDVYVSLFNYSSFEARAFVQGYESYLTEFRESVGISELANIIDEMIARVSKLNYLLTLD